MYKFAQIVVFCVNLNGLKWININNNYEFFIYESVRIIIRFFAAACGIVRAVRAAVYGSAHGSVRAVCVAVCSCSVLGSVTQCAWQCAVV
jgi:hypothetical protein